jgi:hypothetical protein
MMHQRRQRPLSPRDPRAPTRKRQGLSRLAVDELLTIQGGRCKLGGEPLGADFIVDHDHLLAASHPHPVDVGCPLCVRGILCRAKNTALGAFHDSPDELRRAAEYVAWRRS